MGDNNLTVEGGGGRDIRGLPAIHRADIHILQDLIVGRRARGKWLFHIRQSMKLSPDPLTWAAAVVTDRDETGFQTLEFF